jgi:hypothetical protein
MPVDRRHDAALRQRLEALVTRLQDAQLQTPLSDGWTVAAVLAHLAFWDQRAAFMVELWKRQGLSPSEADAEAINNAMKPQWLALAPRVAADLAASAARSADAALDTAPPELIEQIAARGSINVSRANHRTEHLDEIERTLAREVGA